MFWTKSDACCFCVCRPVAKRTKAALESDVKKTGMKMLLCSVPYDFASGPWLVDTRKPRGHKEGFARVEQELVNNLKAYCANKLTPADPADVINLKNSPCRMLSRFVINLKNSPCRMPCFSFSE